MSFILRKGHAKAEPFLKTASVAIAINTPLSFSMGYVRQAAVASTRIAGISTRVVTSSDSDYASNSEMVVLVPMPDAIFEATVSGTATQNNVGNQYDLTTLTDGTAQSVDLAASTYGVVTVVGFINSSTVLVKFNNAYEYTDGAL